MTYTCEHCSDIVKNLDDYDHNNDYIKLYNNASDEEKGVTLHHAFF